MGHKLLLQIVFIVSTILLGGHTTEGQLCTKAPVLNNKTSFSNWTETDGGWNGNTTLIVECYPGYNLTGNATVTCIQNDTWSDIPVCNVIFCPDPTNIATSSRYSNWTNTSGINAANSTLMVGCYPGYELNGSATVECLVDGNWSDVPDCNTIICNNTPEINYTSTYSNWTDDIVEWNANMTLEISCFPGYNLNGSAVVTCINNDTWSDTPDCNLIFCPDPTYIATSSRYSNWTNTSGVMPANSTLMVGCYPGYELNGSATVECLVDGNWSDVPDCNIINCTGSKLEHGTISPGLPVSANSSVNFNCNRGYELVGNDTAECNVTGYFDQFPTCEPKVLPLGNNFTLEVLPESNDSVSIIGIIVSNSTDADAFYVELRTNDTYTDSNYFNITPNENTTITFEDLLSGTRYTLQVYLSNANFRSNESKSIDIVTLPNCVQSWAIANTTRNTMTFAQNITPKGFEYYVFEMPNQEFTVNNLLCNKTNLCIFPSTITELEVTGLVSGSLYNFSFKTAIERTNSSYMYAGSADTCQAFSLYTVPNSAQAESMNLSNRTTSSITVTWTQAERAFDGYNVTFTCKSPNINSAMKARYNSTVYSNEASVFDLDPGTVCIVSVQTYLVNGDYGTLQGDVVTKTFNEGTEEAAPEDVQSQNVSGLTSRSATLHWSVPNIRNGIIRHYIVWINDTNEACIRSALWNCSDCRQLDAPLNISSLEIPQCSFLEPYTFPSLEQNLSWSLTDLHPYREYTAYIAAYTVEKGSHITVLISTLEDFPGKPIRLEAIETSDRSIHLQWSPPEEPNGEITNYTVTYAYYNPICRDNRGQEEKVFIFVNKTIFDNETELIEEIYPFWNYSIVVQATNKIGSGNNSDVLEVRTNESIPDIVDTINSTSIYSRNATITWLYPCFINGELKQFYVELTNTTSPKGEAGNVTHTTQSNEGEIVLVDLLPFRNYSVRVKAENNVATGTYNTSYDFQTPIDVPDTPTGLKPGEKSESLIEVQWDRPTQFTGPTKYIVEVTDISEKKLLERIETYVGWWIDQLATSAKVRALDAYWRYSVVVTAETSYGVQGPLLSHSSPTIVQTAESTPGQVQRLKVVPERALDKPRQLDVTWEPPTDRDLNGIIVQYEVFCTNRNQTILTQSHNRSLTIPLFIDNTADIAVKARAQTSVGWGPYTEASVAVEPGAPETPAETADNPLMKKFDTEVDDDKTMIAVELPKSFLCNNRNGKPVQWGVIVAEESKATDLSFIGSLEEYQKRKAIVYTKWSEVKDADVIPPYLVTSPDWVPNCGADTTRGRRAVQEQSNTLNYIIGNDDCSSNNGYCNGPLQPGRSYRVKSYACTTTGCTETLYSRPIKTAPDLTAAIVGGCVAAVVVIVIVAVVIYTKRTHKLCFAGRAFKPNRLDDDMEFDPIGNDTSQYVFGPGLVKLSEFPLHVEKMHKDINLHFTKAYKMLVERSPCFPTNIAQSESCMPKNRYVNILPYDRTRVRLKPLDGIEGSDYINANYIPGYTFRQEYIATQGPMENTYDDFWRMIWEEKVETIVMLTQLTEKDRVKCDMYWPASKKPVTYGNLVVSVYSEENFSENTLRMFEIKFKEERRLVSHFMYLNWPDMGCPEDPQMLLDFVAAVRERIVYKLEKKGPVVVHCSAGVGRTGTFIAVDHLLQHVRDHDDVDIFQLVLELRENRCQMVQTEDQFIYIHECLKAFIVNDDEQDEDIDDEPFYQNENFGEEANNENQGYKEDE